MAVIHTYSFTVITFITVTKSRGFATLKLLYITKLCGIVTLTILQFTEVLGIATVIVIRVYTLQFKGYLNGFAVIIEKTTVL